MTNITPTKYLKYMIASMFMILCILQIQSSSVQAQEVSVRPGVDFYSAYIWRGVAYSGPSIQPYIELSSGGFAIGAWGSQGMDGSSANKSVGFQEMDLYVSYSFDFGLSLGVTDYYYPGTPYFSYKSDPDNGDFSSHAIELNGSYTIENLSFAANYIVNESPGGAGSAGGDVYYQLGYAAGAAELFVGGGDGWHSTDGDVKIVNVGIGASKEIEITDTFSLPLSGAAILNPDTEQFYIVVGLSL
ncbi:hypothetical protein [Fodinibius sp.]|uniref:hypothetical protein n=1 Tax=Fodinibius sp. TaxID=1872440 RepID=UPI00356AF48B